ncbi:hypothetical protein IFM46972_09173 [Aspergillus udagawae]|uniref:Uncharacterized protein n=1 Tax=Aspergillus udagawae TaxID=91492 RepID=A0A8H3S4M9_9EURO|nr:hypothetical protein IFM46972_09173 [Aspergillus udagawae]
MHSLISNPDREEGSANWAQELLILRSCCRCHIPACDWLQFREIAPLKSPTVVFHLRKYEEEEKRRKKDEEEEEREEETKEHGRGHPNQERP